MIKQYLKKVLSASQKKKLRKFQKNIYEGRYPLLKHILSKAYSNDLNNLAAIHGTDKWNYHWYTQHYQKHFHLLRKKRLNILEIGVGGHEDPTAGGNSLRMWKYYFPNSVIHSIDIYDKSLLQEKRIKIYRGSQADESFLKEVLRQIGSLDIVVDDGSHENEHVISSFKILFPLLNETGIYAIEDVESSYWPESGGDSENLNNPTTIMNFFKGLADSLNYEEIIRPGYVPTYFDKNIVSMHFYHNLNFNYKVKNNERSNYLINNASRS